MYDRGSSNSNRPSFISSNSSQGRVEKKTVELKFALLNFSVNASANVKSKGRNIT